MELGIALPKGRLLAATADILTRAGLEIDDYSDKARLYRLKSKLHPGLRAKIFQEKDIPIQVATGNYDLGICGLDWLEEQLVKFRSSDLVKLKNLGYGDGAVYAAVCDASYDGQTLTTRTPLVRIASEYPNLAEALAQRLRLKRFSVFPLWGAAEAYPPDNADIILLSRKTEDELSCHGLAVLGKVVDFKAVLIANRCSLKEKDLSEFISAIGSVLPAGTQGRVAAHEMDSIDINVDARSDDPAAVRLALPDGHQQAHVRKILDAAGISVEDYPSASGNRSPQSGIGGVSIKVIRPQDMPLQVANGNFDIAITGRDWLTDHKHQFPTSPVIELMDLKYGWVRIVAVVDNTIPVNGRADLKPHCNQLGRPYRVASEYVNIADNYARENQLGLYRIIPTWGATEAFLPEDADMLIENTETGSTIARHNLKIIDTLFESTACVIGRQDAEAGELKRGRIANFLSAMNKGVAALA